MRLTSLLIPFIPFISLVVTATGTSSKVIDLDSTNFDTYVGKSKPALVEFFAPWVSGVASVAGVVVGLGGAD
jgi:hypothetical protein